MDDALVLKPTSRKIRSTQIARSSVRRTHTEGKVANKLATLSEGGSKKAGGFLLIHENVGMPVTKKKAA
jgi:hypothetical protein